MIHKLLFVTVVFTLCSTVRGEQSDFSTARRLLAKGRYEEAFDAFTKAQSSSTQVLGQTECLTAQGKSHEGIARLKAHLKAANETNPAIHAKLAQLYFENGSYEEASRHVQLALAERQDALAMFVKAELERVHGNVDEASKLYETLANLPQDQFNTEERYWIGLARVQHGRWSRNTRVFDQLVNEFYPSLLSDDETFWPAHLEAGRLFLEKHNDADAARELNAALAINPRAAEVHVALGQLALRAFDLDKAIACVERALMINPNLSSAFQLTADIAFTNLQPHNAVEPLRLALIQNPRHEATLGRQLALYLREDGFDSAKDENSRAAQLILEVTARNQHCGRFHEAAGKSLEALRIYPMASKHYQLALERLPQLTSVRGNLGLVQMRLGEETEARNSLEESFKIDPFNVRVKNTLDVLDLLNTYAVIETDHFIIRFDRGHDGVLAEYAARFLEDEVFPDIVESLGYAPREKTLLEIFSKADGTSGHSWFSARMVGLPFIGTVGACAGKMFALTSPADGKSYNWARVLRHEFVHVVNLQQTNFLIPQWFTEALAVRNELGSYPVEWDQVLAKYVDNDRLFDLSNINHGFVRPGSSERWTLAYFQAYLYVDLIEQLGGKTALPRMLESYAKGNSTAETLKSVINKPIEEFESAYKEFVTERAGEMIATTRHESISKLKKELDAFPKDASTLARLAAAYGSKNDTRKARQYADRALAIDASNPKANYAMARLRHLVGDDEKAWQHIEAGLNEKHPDPTLLAFAAKLKTDAKAYDRAAEYYRLGRQHFPNDYSWTRGLARALLLKKDDAGLAQVLAEIADRESDKPHIARKLAQLAMKRKDYKSAEEWANRTLQIDVMNPITHAELAEALALQGKTKAAIREYKTALKLSPGEPTWQTRLRELNDQEKK